MLWGSLGIASREVLARGVSPLELGFWRAALGGLLFALQAGLARQTRVAREDRAAVAAFAVVGVAVFYLSFLLAIRDGGVALAYILLYTAPAWVAIASAALFGEQMGRPQRTAIALTVAGVALVAYAGSGGAGIRVAPRGILWGLCAGLAYASYYLFGRRYLARYAPATLFMYALPLGALLLLPGVDFAPKRPMIWLGIAYVAVVPTWLALQCYGAAVRRLEATRAATMATLEPVVAALLAYFLFGEALGLLGYAGAALVLSGVIVSTLDSRASSIE